MSEMIFDARTLQINGLPYEWVRHKQSVLDLERELSQTKAAEKLREWNDKKSLRAIGFLLDLLEEIKEQDAFLWDNSEILAWYLPFYFTGAAEGKKGKQWKLVKDLEEVRDFVRCFSIYLREGRKLLMRSESSNQKAMVHITVREEELKKEVGEIVGRSSVEVWDQYNQTSHTREPKPSLPDAIARLVCNDLSLYPILSGAFALYIVKKLGHTGSINKGNLVSEAGPAREPLALERTAVLPRAIRGMAEQIQVRLDWLMEEKILWIYPQIVEEEPSVQVRWMYELLYGDDPSAWKKPKKGVLQEEKSPRLPICRVRRLTAELSERGQLSYQEELKLQQRLLSHLYCKQTKENEPQLGKAQDMLDDALKSLRKLSSPRYYGIADPQATDQKEKELCQLVVKITGSEKLDVKEASCFFKRCVRFWEARNTLLFWEAPAWCDLAGLDHVLPGCDKIQRKLYRRAKRELVKELKKRDMDCDPDLGGYAKQIRREWNMVLTLGDAIDLLRQFAEKEVCRAEALKNEASGQHNARTVLNEYIRKKGNQQLTDWWGESSKSANSVNWLYAQLLSDALRLLIQAGMGVLYRACFQAYRETEQEL